VPNERILVVDDEQGVVRSCVRILQRQGYVVSGKMDSLSVPALLKQETFDLLLTDIKMPKLDGLELLSIAKEIDRVYLVAPYCATAYACKPFCPSWKSTRSYKYRGEKFPWSNGF
jgi:DNA-binding NtrC family response regulator